jgi:cytochrome d ubiquinol oxidase subunit I
MISQFAVGGGLYLPMAERKAHAAWPTPRCAPHGWQAAGNHSKFFLILTGVFGTVSGVGIWFAIGLTHPEATSTLIHNFVFGWAMEWVFFLVELATVAVYYYTWNRIDEKLHLTVGWVYAGASAATLIIINGILAFMLTPGDTWLWRCRNRPRSQQVLECLLQSHLLAEPAAARLRLLLAGRLSGRSSPPARSTATSSRRSRPARSSGASSGWCLLSSPCPFLMIWYYMMVPASQQALLTLGIDTINAGTFSAVTRMALVIIVTSATIIWVAYYLAYRNPLDFNLSHALAVLLLALMATGAGEYSREMLRKPYVIGHWMYSNGVRVPYVSQINQEGYLAHSNWVWNGSAPATRAARPSSAANAAPATRWTATGPCGNC